MPNMIKKTILLSAAASWLLAGGAFAQTTLVNENFDEVAAGTAITATNTTALNYARFGTGTGASLNAQTSTLTTPGQSALLVATSASLTGIGTSGLANFSAGILSFSVATPSTLGTFFFATGTGATFTSNSTFSGSDLLAGFQITSTGLLQTRNSSNAFVTIASAPTITASTAYTIKAVFNGSASTVTYTSGTNSGTVAPDTADFYLNGTQVGDDVSIRQAATGSAFRIYTTGATAATGYEVDNVVLTSLVAGAVVPIVVPEPSTYACVILGGFGVLAMGRFRRRVA